MNNEQFIKDLLPLVGGKENIKKAIHCQTRLRLTLYDYDLVQKDAVRALEGKGCVQGTFEIRKLQRRRHFHREAERHQQKP